MLAQLVVALRPRHGKRSSRCRWRSPVRRDRAARVPRPGDDARRALGRVEACRHLARDRAVPSHRRDASILVDQVDEGFEYQLDRWFRAAHRGQPAAFAVVPGESRLISDVGLDDERSLPADFGFWMCARTSRRVARRAVVSYVSDWRSSARCSERCRVSACATPTSRFRPAW